MADGTGLLLVSVRVANFRSLRVVEVLLSQFTLLTGENNSGKTSFLEAISAAIGLPRRVIVEDDIFLSEGEQVLPRDRKVQIDLMFRPVGDDGQILESFPEGSRWTSQWGPGISQDEQDHDFVALRTEAAWNPTKGDYETTRQFLSTWAATLGDMERSRPKTSPGVSAAHLEAVALYFMDAKRDIDDDLRRQGSFWRRLTSDLGIPAADAEAFEQALESLNAEIIDKSEVLKHIKENLDSIESLVSSKPGSIEIAPVAPRLRDLAKGIEINFATDKAQRFSLSRHGMGTRSLATLLVFKAFTSWRMKNAVRVAIHPLLGLEEPEAHLHPQAQRAAFDKISQMPGQLIVSTHSPYFAGRVRLDAIRHFTKKGSTSEVASINLSDLTADDIRSIERTVINTRGDVLFARTVVLFEGETEEVALPVWGELYWSDSLHDLGFSFVGVGGSGKFLPFMRICSALSIPFFVFADGDDGFTSVAKAFAAIGVADPSQATNLFRLSTGVDIESYLINGGYATEIRSAVDEVEGQVNYLASYIAKMNGQLHSKLGTRDYTSPGGEARALYDLLRGDKTRYARAVATSIGKIANPNRRVPEAIKALFATIRPAPAARP